MPGTVRLRWIAPPELRSFFDPLGRRRSSPRGELYAWGPFDILEEDLDGWLDLGTRANVAWLQAHPQDRRAIEVARYEREQGSENDWLTVPLVLGLYADEYARLAGHRPLIDCEDLSMADAAEERLRTAPHARATAIYVSPTMRHIVTDTGAGIRDVSKFLIDTGRGSTTWNP